MAADSNNKPLIHESQSLAPTISVFILSAAVLISIVGQQDIPMGNYGLFLVFGSAMTATFVYFKRSMFTEYVVNEGTVGVLSYLTPSFLGNGLKTMELADAKYIYSRQTGIRWFLAKLNFINYGDICFCKDVKSRPYIVFHNVSHVKDKVKMLQEEARAKPKD